MLCPSCSALVDDSADYCPSCLNELARAVDRAPATGGAAAVAVAPIAVPDVAPAAFEERFPGQQACAVHPEFPVASTCQRCGKFVCIRCAPELASAEKASCADCAVRTAPPQERIGGWLILVGLGLGLGPPSMLYRCFTIWSSVYDSWQKHGGLSALQVEIAVLYLALLALVLYGVVVAIAFFKMKRSVPTLVILNFVGYAVFCLARAILERDLSETVVSSNMANLVRSLITAAIWIPYFKVSKRVKATFVR